MMQLTDSYNRQLTYLRLSVTDRCQFRCVYCTPIEGIPKFPKEQYLTADEMERLVLACAQMGVWRLRLTGGEPLLRPDILSLVARFSSIPGITDLALSTNGELLGEMADDLKHYGLKRVNISLDSLDPERFFQLTQSRSFDRVWKGIHQALKAGLQVKLNVVALQGMTKKEILDFSKLATDLPVEVRFIEFMPLCGSGWKPELVLPMAEIREVLIGQGLRALTRGSEVAESYQIAGGKGRIGMIASLTEPFCTNCSRIRVSSMGKIQLCLFSGLQVDLLNLLRSEAPIEEIQARIREIVFHKPERHPYTQEGRFEKRPAHGHMRQIGG